MPQPVAVIFDAFGTLLKILNGRHPYLKLLKLGQTKGRRPRPDDAQVLLREPLSFAEAADRLGIDVTSEELLPLQEMLSEEVAAIQPYSDGLEAVSLLIQRGIRVAICSNLAYPYREAIFNNYPSIDTYVLSCDVGLIKPSAEIYHNACEALQVLPSRAWMIGDSLRCDKEGPQAIGIKGFHLNRDGNIGDCNDLMCFARSILAM